jgi:hypothetical protein
LSQNSTICNKSRSTQHAHTHNFTQICAHFCFMRACMRMLVHMQSDRRRQTHTNARPHSRHHTATSYTHNRALDAHRFRTNLRARTYYNYTARQAPCVKPRKVIVGVVLVVCVVTDAWDAPTRRRACMYVSSRMRMYECASNLLPELDVLGCWDVSVRVVHRRTR